MTCLFSPSLGYEAVRNMSGPYRNGQARRTARRLWQRGGVSHIQTWIVEYLAVSANHPIIGSGAQARSAQRLHGNRGTGSVDAGTCGTIGSVAVCFAPASVTRPFKSVRTADRSADVRSSGRIVDIVR